MNASHMETYLVFSQLILHIFLSWNNEFINFPSLISWHTLFIQFMTFLNWFGKCFMHLGGFFTFSKTDIVRIQLTSLGIQISNVIIYLGSLLFYNFNWCTLMQCKVVLYTNFSLQFWVDLCMSSSNFFWVQL